MFKKIWKKLNTRYYHISEDKMIEFGEAFEREIRKEYEDKINNLQEQMKRQQVYLCKLEKDNSSLVTSNDILKNKMQILEIELEESKYKNKSKGKENKKHKDLAAEIFGG
ncbi:hypothetical protein [Clostridium cylindrosporum]|uniref:Uncharacterized protein n=1 Tax=Clostridium cylindrosporum DSM 605 TaxID=1121307 RepID=A0A0J8DDM3_CLOCY|nr:hypothetical protein [Clostridium cylindrosporum]KMT22328.1 hypothetical protein CLCY_16c00070 [Clostridium cylindrosporum DSM 605]